MADRIASDELAERVCNGDPRAMARLITRTEGGERECRDALAALYRRTGRAHVVGITGVPGAGKSSLVSELARTVRGSGRRVAVIAIDPSSPFSGGAILGDRIRMSELVSDPGVFIRSMATRGSLGGLARPALDAVDVLDAGGFDVVLIETVGVGQDEVDVVRAAHTTVVVNAPGLGDDIQAIKAGILEIADVHVVSKADRPDANRTVRELKSMLMMSMPEGPDAWHVPVIPTSTEEGSGFDELLAALDRHREHLNRTGEIDTRRRRIASTRVVKIAEEIVRDSFLRAHPERIDAMLERVVERELDPHGAALELLDTVKERIRYDE
ncbi:MULTISPECIES: methylmalonyl Co-A mutase-associated GTPase MeaB [Arhodomonas]|uniref:methylmalonyl Co-A mutase-associated GTPase MeaB n=1 Tax=Arhodomonas TaxID=2368 RepID=UPI00035D9A9F|nr:MULTISPECIES: methylmalonyl Co-A mutase-associated GTPase MeaB [Arhodomonas]